MARTKKPSRKIEPNEDDDTHDTELPIDNGSSSKKAKKQKNDEPIDDREEIEGDHEEGENPDDDSAAHDGSTKYFRTLNKSGRPAEAGIITKCYMENFMCHRKVTVDLCRNVNFINGQNGSGKSAILAAIQICLGAGAKRTHRARNLKDLIRKEAGNDCSGAIVRVTLLNQGGDGYCREIYGDRITVERCISKNGYNGYKLRDAGGKEKSRLKKDLDAMLDQLNIQVENPVAVLDQEEAKKFLMGKNDDKYRFFAKATELERLDRSYAAVVDNIEDLDESQIRVSNSMASSRDIVKALEQEWKESQELEKLEDKIADYSVSYAWSCYNSLHEKLQEQEAIARGAQDKMDKRREDLEKAEASADVNGDEENTCKEKLDQLTEEATAATLSKRELQTELRTTAAPIRKHEQELKNLKKETNSANRNLSNAKKHLQEARDEILQKSGSRQSEEAKRLEKLKTAEDQIQRTKEELNSKKEKIAELLKQYEDLEPLAEQAKQDTSAVNAQMHGVNKKLKDLESSQGDSLAVFGQKCALMDQKVRDARRRFQGSVIGPIGKYIKIAPGKEELAKIAEHAIGADTLQRFIVTTDADRQLFQKLRQDAGCSSRDCGVFQIADVPKYKVPPSPSPDVDTIESTINVTNDLVYNCLVDNAKIDLRALAKSKDVSEQALIVQNSDGSETMLGNKIQQVFFLPNGDFWQLRNGFRTMISNEHPGRLRQTIGVDRSAAIQSTKNEITLLKREYDEKKKNEGEVIHKCNEVKLTWNQQNTSSRKLTNKMESLRNTLDQVNSEAEAAENSVTIDTTELEEDVTCAEEKLEELRQKEKIHKHEIQQAQPTVEELNRKMEEITMRNNKVLEDIARAEKKMEEYINGKNKYQVTLEKKRKKIELLEQTVEKQTEVVNELTSKADESMNTARLLTVQRQKQKNKDGENNDDPQSTDLESIDPQPTNKKPDFYKAKIDSTRKQIERERQKRQISESDPEVILEKYLRAKGGLDKKMKSIDDITENRNILIVDLKARKKRFRHLRKHISDMTDAVFDQLLNKKGSSGQLIFDHKEGKESLDLIVQKDNMNEQSQTKDVKALSGGERSFATLALLLALGENLETPFRVMDEFDVFLDPVARKIALTTMVEMALDMEHRQFIFITPQDLSSIKPTSKLKIIKMKAPVRNAVAGGVVQQTLD